MWGLVCCFLVFLWWCLQLKKWAVGETFSHQPVSSSPWGSVGVGGYVDLKFQIDGAAPQVQTTSVRCPVSILLEIESMFL